MPVRCGSLLVCLLLSGCAASSVPDPLLVHPVDSSAPIPAEVRQAQRCSGGDAPRLTWSSQMGWSLLSVGLENNGRIWTYQDRQGGKITCPSKPKCPPSGSQPVDMCNDACADYRACILPDGPRITLEGL